MSPRAAGGIPSRPVPYWHVCGRTPSHHHHTDHCYVAQERWLASGLSLRAETLSSYRELIANYTVPHLGRLLVRGVRAADMQTTFTGIILAHEQTGRPLSVATLQRIYAVSRASFNAAVRGGLIEANPLRGVELPAARPVRAVVWTDERVAAWRCGGTRPVVAVWTAAQTASFLRSVRHGGMRCST